MSQVDVTSLQEPSQAPEPKMLKRKRLKLSNTAADAPKHVKKSTKRNGDEGVKDMYLDTIAEESEDSDYVSSPEDDEDEEEAEIDAEISEEMKGFIVDKADDSEVSEEASDVEYEPNELDDEDLALIAENTGTRYTRGSGPGAQDANNNNNNNNRLNQDRGAEDDDEGNTMQLRRLKKGLRNADALDNWLDDEDGGDTGRGGIDMSDIWATVAECFGDVDLVVAILKNEKAVQAAAEPASDDDDERDSDYNDADAGKDRDEDDSGRNDLFRLDDGDDADGTRPRQSNLPSKDVLDIYADPDELTREYLTKEDEKIRLDDQPERLSIRYKNRSRPVAQTLIEDEAHWLSRMLIKEYSHDLSVDAIKERYKDIFKDTYPVPDTSPLDDVREKCILVLHWLLNERYEVPFIIYHKRHLICPPLTDAILWRLYELDLEWWRLKTRADELKAQIETIGHENIPSDVLYYTMNFENAIDLHDVAQHILYYFYKTIRPSAPTPKAAGEANLDFDDVTQTRDKNLTVKHGDDDLQRGDAGSDADGDDSGVGDANNFEIEQDIFGDFEADAMSEPDHNASLLDVEDFDNNNGCLYNENGVLQDANDREFELVTDAVHHKSPASASASAGASPVSSLEDPLDVSTVMASTHIGKPKPLQSAAALKKRDVSMYLVESVEELGLNELWRGFIPLAQHFAQVLEKSIVADSNDFIIDADAVKEAFNELGIQNTFDMSNLLDARADVDEQAQIEHLCQQYTRGPYTSGKRVYTALVSYHAKLLANNLTIKRILREYYRKVVAITCTTTSKGEESVDVADPSWICRRLYRCPLHKFINKGRQFAYEWPESIQGASRRRAYIEEETKACFWPEFYLKIAQQQRQGAINVTIHPLYATERVPWKQEPFQERFSEWREQYKNTNIKIHDDAIAAKLAKQKALLEKEELMLAKAEERDRLWRRNVLDQLAFAYCPSNVPSFSIFKSIQRAILDRLLNVELIPKFKNEVMDELTSLATSSIILNCQRRLQLKLDLEPHECDAVMSMVVQGPEQGLKVHAVVVDEYGNTREHYVFNDLVAHCINTKAAGYNNLVSYKQMKNDIDTLAQLVSQRAPRVILIGLTSLYSLDLYARLDEYLLPLLEQKIPILKMDTEVCRLRAHSNLDVSRRSNLGSSGVDDLMDSSSREFQMALSLARWYLDPLAEVCNLWDMHGTNLILKLNLHPLQHLVSQERLEAALEGVLVDAVCRAGVDLNRVKRCAHLEAPLQFVAGLGPRKRFDILRILKTSTIATRSQLRVTQQQQQEQEQYEPSMGIGDCVFTNAASFIKISPPEVLDVLDTTRIHVNESAYIAEKLSTDALDEDIVGDEAIQEIFENPKRLDDLDLEAYARLLLEKQQMARMLPYLLFVKDELQNPYKDNRSTWEKPSPVQTLRGVLQMNIDVASHMLVRIDAIFDTFARASLLPLNLKANIVDFRSFRENAIRVLSASNQSIDVLRGTSLSCRVQAIDYHPIVDCGRHSYRVDVALTSHMRKMLLSNVAASINVPDEYKSPLASFDIEYSKRPILTEYTEKRKIQYRRMIRHPSYRMWPVHKVVAFLRQPELPVGECCICPSTEWDRLNLVIKTCLDPYNVATFIIFEKNQRIPGELGKELYLQQDKYDNLDQIIAQFCETLKLNLDEFYMHPKYKASTDMQKVERDLIQESAMKPDSIAWAILPPNPRQKGPDNSPPNPLRFTLVVVPPGLSLVQGTCKSLVDHIYVDHKCFRLWTHTYKSLAQLLSWWKQYGYWNRTAERQKYALEKRRHAQRRF